MLLSFHFFFDSFLFASRFVRGVEIVLDLRLKTPPVKKKSPAFFLFLPQKKQTLKYKTTNAEEETSPRFILLVFSRNNTNRRLSRKQRTRLEREEFLREKRRHSLSSLVSHHVLRVKEEEIIVSLKIHLSFRERSLKF